MDAIELRVQSGVSIVVQGQFAKGAGHALESTPAD